VADQGRGGLESMTASMQQLDEAMNAFTRKLSTISQRATGITSVVDGDRQGGRADQPALGERDDRGREGG